MGISKKKYDELKDKYSGVASWAIWTDVGAIDKPKSNTGDLSVFDDKKIHEKLNDKFVLVGLNVSREENPTRIWGNFHSESQYQNDYKLRYALIETKLEGSYMTDIIKHCKESKQENVQIDQDSLKKHIEKFEDEIITLNGNKKDLTIIAMGNKVYNILTNNLKDEYTIVKITHYAYRIGKENYKKRIQEQLKKYNINIEENINY